MLPIVVNYTSTPDLVRRSYRACHGRSIAVRWAVCATFVAIGLLSGQWPPAVVGVVFAVLMELSVRRQLRPYLQRPRDITTTITDDEYRVQGPDRTTALKWSAITGVRQSKGFWVLRVDPVGTMAFPATMLDDAATQAFTDLMRAKGLLR